MDNKLEISVVELCIKYEGLAQIAGKGGLKYCRYSEQIAVGCKYYNKGRKEEVGEKVYKGCDFEPSLISFFRKGGT